MIVRSTPSAARRRPNGSRVPVGFCPIAKMPASVSSLSASASAIPRARLGNAVAREARPILFFQRGADFGRLAVVLRVVLAHQVPAARETRRPSASADRTCSARRRDAASVASAADATRRCAPRGGRRARSCRTASRASPGTSRSSASGGALRAARDDRCPRRMPRPRAAAVPRARCRRAPCPVRGSARLATAMNSLRNLPCASRTGK